jgi:hypothetical protein
MHWAAWLREDMHVLDPLSRTVLFGTVQMRTDTNVLVGSGDVIIQSIS